MTQAIIKHIFSYCILIIISACGGTQKSDNTTQVIKPACSQTEKFNADSAFTWVKTQVDFGPRVPGTEPHRKCADWLANRLKQWSDTIEVHSSTMTAWNGDKLPLYNIIARIKGDNNNSRPIMLMAHWDTRPWADAQYPGTDDRNPIDGANDGASGTAIILELARQAAIHGVTRPLIFMLVDGEDYGAPQHVQTGENTWCLGTQSWIADGMPGLQQKPEYAILLDMVGGRNAVFNREYFSDAYAKGVVDILWQKASSLGLGERFIQSRGGAVVDDHIYLNRAGIPAIDIIESINPETGSFNPTWHTLDDNINNIDPETLRVVGSLVESLTIKS